METRKPMEMLPENESRKAKLETWMMMAERENRVNAQWKKSLTITALQRDKIGGHG
jgi:hypothetical protein